MEPQKATPFLSYAVILPDTLMSTISGVPLYESHVSVLQSALIAKTFPGERNYLRKVPVRSREVKAPVAFGG